MRDSRARASGSQARQHGQQPAGTTNDGNAGVRAVVAMRCSVGERAVPAHTGPPHRETRTLGDVEGLNTDLDLNGSASPRVRPRVGEWAPADVPSTRQKRNQRWWTLVAATAVLVAVVAFGYFAYLMLRGY